MPQDYADSQAEERSRAQGRLRRWYATATAVTRLAVTTVAIAVAGLLIGYVVAAVAIFPPANTAGDLVRAPDVVGRTGEEARQRLERAGLEYREVAVFHHEAAAGTVLAQEPLAGQRVRQGSTVEVTVSLGPKGRSVPDVMGLNHQQAEVALTRSGYTSELAWVDADADVGKVVGTRLAPRSPLEQAGKVRLFVSAGPPRVAVPNLITRSLAEADAELGRLGLRLGTVRRDSASLAAPGTVLTQSPASGTVVERATPVAVTVAQESRLGEPADTASNG